MTAMRRKADYVELGHPCSIVAGTGHPERTFSHAIGTISHGALSTLKSTFEVFVSE
jgi:hypothetical protein